MNMFSKELRELDKNTVQYMIDAMQEEIDASRKMLLEKDTILSAKDKLLHQQAQENRLYTLLSKENRLAELGRAVSDADFRRQLLEEYGL